MSNFIDKLTGNEKKTSENSRGSNRRSDNSMGNSQVDDDMIQGGNYDNSGRGGIGGGQRGTNLGGNLEDDIDDNIGNTGYGNSGLGGNQQRVGQQGGRNLRSQGQGRQGGSRLDDPMNDSRNSGY